jgi:hypothetical protein
MTTVDHSRECAKILRSHTFSERSSHPMNKHKQAHKHLNRKQNLEAATTTDGPSVHLLLDLSSMIAA